MNHHPHRQILFILGALLLVLSAASDALAVLGGDRATVSRTRSSMAGSNAKVRQSKSQSNLSSYEEIETDGMRIREYADANGKIFAVTWRGVAEPDLSVLLGRYFSEYRIENERRAPSRARSKNVETGEIKVRRAGHMRDKHGVAFVPALVPVGVTVEDLE